MTTIRDGGSPHQEQVYIRFPERVMEFPFFHGRANDCLPRIQIRQGLWYESIHAFALETATFPGS